MAEALPFEKCHQSDLYMNESCLDCDMTHPYTLFLARPIHMWHDSILYMPQQIQQLKKSWHDPCIYATCVHSYVTWLNSIRATTGVLARAIGTKRDELITQGQVITIWQKRPLILTKQTNYVDKRDASTGAAAEEISTKSRVHHPQARWVWSHVTHMDESCHTHRWVMLHTWMSHVTHMNESCVFIVIVYMI